ncbi:MAG: hypothetical protein GF344_01185 [Chitinivibrionales bacterium]|nr:hypothetical protein [Chitinivibrionales bacterium]MBD3355711.1 hypothetical protein [Chitinivibrionales bacterium]
MNVTLKVTHNIEAGLVLDREGRWVSLTTAVERERDHRRHLEQGEILVGNQWRDLDKIKKTSDNRDTTEHESERVSEDTAIIFYSARPRKNSVDTLNNWESACRRGRKMAIAFSAAIGGAAAAGLAVIKILFE